MLVSCIRILVDRSKEAQQPDEGFAAGCVCFVCLCFYCTTLAWSRLFTTLQDTHFLIEEAENLSAGVSATCLLVIHDAVRGGQNQETKLTRRQQLPGPVLNASECDVETGADHSALVDAPDQIHHQLSATVIVNEFELANVAMLLHHGQEFDDDLGRGSNQDLPLALAFGVRDGLEAVSQYRHTHHLVVWVVEEQSEAKEERCRSDV